MSSVRMHFWTLVARGQGAACWPMKYGTNCTMPAATNSRFGSSKGSGALGTTVCPLRSKCPRKRARISADLTHQLCQTGAAGLPEAGPAYSAGAAAGAGPGGPSKPVSRRSSLSRSVIAARTSAEKSPIASASSRSAAATPCAIPVGVSFSAARESLRTTRAPIVTPIANQNSRLIAPPRTRRSSAAPAVGAALAAGAADDVGVPALGDGLAHAVGERGRLDHRAAEGARVDRGQGGHVGGHRVDVRGDAFELDELVVDRLQRLLRVGQQRADAVARRPHREGGLVERAAELEQRHRQQQYEQDEGTGRNERGDLASRHRASQTYRLSTHRTSSQPTLSGHSARPRPRMMSRSRASRSTMARSAPRPLGS